MDYDSEGRVAIVTGVGRGIGSAVASLLAREGARVVINDFSAEGWLQELEDFGRRDEAQKNRDVWHRVVSGITLVADEANEWVAQFSQRVATAFWQAGLSLAATFKEAITYYRMSVQQCSLVSQGGSEAPRTRSTPRPRPDSFRQSDDSEDHLSRPAEYTTPNHNFGQSEWQPSQSSSWNRAQGSVLAE